MLVFSLAGAPLNVSQDATRAVNLLCCRSPGGKVARFGTNEADTIQIQNRLRGICENFKMLVKFHYGHFTQWYLTIEQRPHIKSFL